MSKTGMEAKIDNIFATLGPRYRPSSPTGGNATLDEGSGSMMLEQAWIELYRLVDPVLDMQE